MKKVYSFILITVFSASVFAQTVPSYVPTNGLVGWWPFNGNANDESGNGHNGTVNGATLTTDRFGNAGRAYSFPNSNDNISMSGVTQLNVLKYSVSGWFKKSNGSMNIEGNIFCGSNPLITKGLRFHIGSNNQAAWGVEDVSANGSVWSCSKSQNYADNTWHFFTVIFDATQGVVDSTDLKIWIDNVEIPKIQKVWGNQSSVTAPISNSNLPTIIGNVTGGNDNFKGVLDDIGIWNRALTQAEITTLYTANGVGIKDQSLNQLSIYPNPAKTQITLNATTNQIGKTLKVYDALGKVVYESIIKQEQSNISITNWANGIYTVAIPEQNLTYKFVKE